VTAVIPEKARRLIIRCPNESHVESNSGKVSGHERHLESPSNSSISSLENNPIPVPLSTARFPTKKSQELQATRLRRHAAKDVANGTVRESARFGFQDMLLLLKMNDWVRKVLHSYH
jgi:hypothetical protein